MQNFLLQVSSLADNNELKFLKTPQPTPRTKRKTEDELNNENMNQRSQSVNNPPRRPLNSPHQNPQHFLAHPKSSEIFNVSQDSGLSPSPYDLRFKHLSGGGPPDQTPPPLPPKMKSATPPTNVFTPTLYVKNPQNYPLDSSLENVRGAWRQQQRHRVEAQRNSLLFSSDEDDMDNAKMMEKTALNRMSAMELSQTFTEPFPAELDFSQIVNFKTASAGPPPPPPRDPRRKLYLSSSPTCHRPVSYSFEKPDVVQQKIVPSQIQEQSANRGRELVRDFRQGRAASASSYFHGSVPDLVSHSRPTEYWKSPPPPFVPTFDPYLKYNSNEAIDIPPPRPPRPNLRKKLSNTSSDSRGRDSAIGPSPMLLGGKSSPSSSSVTSRDSGCPELPVVVQPLVPPVALTRPLSTLIESQLSVQENEELDEEVEVIHCGTELEDSTATESWSPPRTDDSHPGFSSRQRRTLFRNAINEIEDLIGQVGQDTDLLDRAERRDLPTAHQELIAQARNESMTSLNTSNEMLFSDMDNFMNWNTSSSFENIPEKTRNRTPSRRRSGAINKVTDDVVYRLCRDNNKPVGNDDPGVKCNQSYLKMSPALTPASSLASKMEISNEEEAEPDVHFDDVHYRVIRDLQRGVSQDPEPKFGIPKDKVVSGSSNKDYLHAVPDLQRYRYYVWYFGSFHFHEIFRSIFNTDFFIADQLSMQEKLPITS